MNRKIAAVVLIITILTFCTYYEISFYNKCKENSGNYKFGRQSFCVSTDGRILGIQ